jgi:hypothetical protein
VNEHPLSERSPARTRHPSPVNRHCVRDAAQGHTSSRTRGDVMIPFRTPGHLSFNLPFALPHLLPENIEDPRLRGQFMPAIAAKLCVKSQQRL